jgi:hypothetical protein
VAGYLYCVQAGVEFVRGERREERGERGEERGERREERGEGRSRCNYRRRRRV